MELSGIPFESLVGWWPRQMLVLGNELKMAE